MRLPTRGRLTLASVSVAVALSLTACTSNGTNTTPTTTPATSVPTTAAPADLPQAQPITCSGSAAAAGSGPVTAADLCNATLQIPSWASSDEYCPHGSVKLSGGQNAATAQRLAITALANVAVTGTAADDAAVTVDCHVGDPATQQVVVFSRTPGGAIATVGQVVGPKDGDIRVVDIGGRTDGTVLVQVCLVHGSNGRALLSEVQQWRGYRFDGQVFTQTSGSTSFEADTTATRLTVAPLTLVLGPGSSHATLTVVVTNIGTTAVADVSLRPVMSSQILAVPNADCPSSPVSFSPAETARGVVMDGVLCDTPSIAPGATWTARIDLSINDPKAVETDPRANIIQLRLGDQHYSDNQVTITGP